MEETENGEQNGDARPDRVQVNEGDLRRLEQTLELFKQRNKEFAMENEKVKGENINLLEYAERCKVEGERSAMQAREEGFTRAMNLNRDRIKARDIPYRKPEIYKTGENFKRWLKSFKIFAETAQIPREYRINTLITFLDATAQMKVETLDLNDEKKREPDECYEQIARAIEGTTLKNECRARLFKLKQGTHETVTDFTTKLTDLAERVYDNDNSQIKGQIMLDCFVAGLKSDRLAYDLIKEEFDTFQTAYQRALDLESIYALRDKNRGEEEGDSLFQIKEGMNVSCHICNTGRIQNGNNYQPAVNVMQDKTNWNPRQVKWAEQRFLRDENKGTLNY